MSTFWNQDVRHVRDGESVDAAVTGRPTRSLEARTSYLKERLDALEAAGGLYRLDAPLHPDCVEGMPLYWRASSSRFEPALADVEIDSSTGTYVNKESANVVGILANKASVEVGDVLLMGGRSLDIAGVVEGGVVTSGRYVLSSRTAGYLVRSNSPDAVPVLIADGEGYVYVLPQVRDIADRHSHYRIELHSVPAGHHAPPDDGGRHVITDDDSDLVGWLPADNAVFAGSAPEGAKFGYNISKHQSLLGLWPPVPITAGRLTAFAGRSGYGEEVSVDRYLIDSTTIWWMLDCYGEVPWPTLYDSNALVSSSSSGVSLSSESSTANECPRGETGKYLVADFARAAYGVEASIVTSLVGVLPLVVKCSSGAPGSSGDLEVSFDPAAIVVDENAVGSRVVKEIDGPSVHRGVVVEGLKAGDDSVTLSSSTTRREIPGDNTTALVYQGIVTVQANLEPSVRALPALVDRLSDVRPRYANGITYLAFPAGQASSLRAQFRLPPGSNFPSNPQVQARLTLLAPSAGTLPGLTVSARRLPRASAGAIDVPLTDSSLDVDTAISLGADQYRELTTDALSPVAAEDLVFVTVARAAGDDYADDVGLIDLTLILSPGS